MAAKIDERKLAAKELLLADYEYFSELLVTNEQSGETRVNWFIVIVSSATAGIVALVVKHAEQLAAYTASLKNPDTNRPAVAGPALSSHQIRMIIIGALVGLLVFGLVTMFRMMTRNKNTDDYKKALDTVRQAFQDHLDGLEVLHGYYPFGVPAKHDPNNDRSKGVSKNKVWSIGQQRSFGGLVFIVAAINSVLVGVVFAAISYDAQSTSETLWQDLAVAMMGMGVSFIAMWVLIRVREAGKNNKRDEEDLTHAGGVVFQEINGSVTYLIVRPKDMANEWVLPKGKIRKREGHAEAALREVREESGVIAKIVCPIGRVRFKAKDDEVRAKFYLMKQVVVGTAKDSRTPEWWPYEKAHSKLTHQESKEILESAQARKLGK